MLKALDPLSRYIMIAKVAAVLVLLAWGLRVNDLRARWHHQYDAEHAGRLADRTTYVAAQAQAKANNQAHVQQVEQQYQRNSDDERQAYLSDLAKLRAQRVRPQAAAPASPAGGTGSPAPVGAAGGADGDGLHLSADEHLQAAEIELRLMHLQNWVDRQIGVDPNK